MWGDRGVKRQCGAGVERLPHVLPGDGTAEVDWDGERERGATMPQVPDPGMSARDEVGRRCLLEPTHARAALVQMSLVALHAMGDVRRGTLLGGGTAVRRAGGYHGAVSVVTRAGVTPVSSMASWKHVCAAVAFRRSEK